MAQKTAKAQARSAEVSGNGDGPIHAAMAETVAPEQDVEAEITIGHSDPRGETLPKKTRFSDYTLSDDEDEADESEPILTKCPARKPNEFDIFRIRPGADWRMEILIVEYRGDNPAVPRGFYMVHPRLRQAFGNKGRRHLIVTCINTNGSMFLWPIKLTEGFGASWCTSALRILETAEQAWVKDFRSAGNGYDADRSKRDHGNPRWLGEHLDQLLEFAFDGRIVNDRMHPLCIALEIE